MNRRTIVDAVIAVLVAVAFVALVVHAHLKSEARRIKVEHHPTTGTTTATNIVGPAEEPSDHKTIDAEMETERGVRAPALPNKEASIYLGRLVPCIEDSGGWLEIDGTKDKLAERVFVRKGPEVQLLFRRRQPDAPIEVGDQYCRGGCMEVVGTFPIRLADTPVTGIPADYRPADGHPADKTAEDLSEALDLALGLCLSKNQPKFQSTAY